MNATDPPPTPPSATTRVRLLSSAAAPALLARPAAAGPDGRWRRLAFEEAGRGRSRGERRWRVELPGAPGARWHFRVDAGDAEPFAPAGPDDEDVFETALGEVWLQDGQLFGYPPAATVSPSAVVKLPDVAGSLGARSLYVYVPRGYHEHPQRRYPVLYMHDGQNCFEAFEADSYAGSWRADGTADRLIARGAMRECLIVGVANGREARLAEYLPPYSAFVQATRPRAAGSPGAKRARRRLVGRAERTAAYYQHEVAPFVAARYRTLPGREHTATCGSSMGGLFSAYLAWEHPGFARHHAIMSPSFWITRDARGRIETVERFRRGPKRDLRLWLDSGTRDAPGRGDDNLRETVLARDALLALGYRQGDELCYHRAEGATHHEEAWAARLPRVFRFLFPAA